MGKAVWLAIVAAISSLCVDGLIAQSPGPENYIYTSSSDLASLGDKLTRPDISGVQVVYSWKSLEPEQGRYDFSAIESDLRILEPLHKGLFIQIQDRFFTPQDKNVPAYLMRDPIYTGGIVKQADNPGENKPVAYGWAAEQWNPNVRHRYHELLRALANKFDGRVTGVNLPESAVEVDMKHDTTGFTCNQYFDAELENMKAARESFKKSYVVQYINFWPCEWGNDHNYMRRSFEFAAQNGIGVGGPDIVPNQTGQMKNSYPFFHEYKDRLALIAMAVQEPTLTYTNPRTHKPFTKEEFVQFGRDYLGTRIIFWSASSPCSTQIMPLAKTKHKAPVNGLKSFPLRGTPMSALEHYPHITPFLWFDANAEEAVDFYLTVFKDARRLDQVATPDAKILTISFEIEGQTFTALNGGPYFKFNEAVSFVVRCDTQAEVDDYWAKLTGGGSEGQCGWLKDKFGLSWQIVPRKLPELIRNPTAMKAMMGMKKLDIAELERAAES